MSELVRKMHDLQKQVFLQEEIVSAWRTLYASEVNHSEEFARLMKHMHLPCSRPMCSFCHVLNEHEQRRQDDLRRLPDGSVTPTTASESNES